MVKSKNTKTTSKTKSVAVKEKIAKITEEKDKMLDPNNKDYIQALYDYVSDLHYYFETLDRMTYNRYKPAWDELRCKTPYTVKELCNISYVCEELDSLISKSNKFLRIKEDLVVKAFIKKCLCTKYIDKSDFEAVCEYRERFNAFEHFIAQISNVDEKANNIIVSIFRQDNSGIENAISRIVRVLNVAKIKLEEDGAEEGYTKGTSPKNIVYLTE